MNWVILVLISAVFLSFRTIFTKKLLFKNNTLPLLFLVSLFSATLMLFFKTQITLDFSLNMYILLLVKSLVITIAWFCIYQAYKHLEVSTVSPLRNLSPVFLVILSLIFLHESITLMNYLGIFALMMSAYALELKSLSDFLEPLKLFKNKFFIYIVISLVGNSVSAILDKILLQEINYYSVMFVFYVFLTIIFFILLILLKELGEVKHLFGYQFGLVILVTISALIADLSYFIAVAIPSTMIVLIIPLRKLSTFISTIVGGSIFRESNIFYKGAVCLVMILGVFLVTI